MSITIEPRGDHLGAICDFFRQYAGVGNPLGFMGANPTITAELDNHPAGAWGIVVEDAGGPGSDMYLPQTDLYIGVRYFGPNAREANKGYRYGDALFNPKDGRPSSFVFRGVAITVRGQVGGPIRGVDPTDDSDFVRVVYSTRVMERAGA